VNFGYALTYAFTVPIGGIGKLFSFRVRADNLLGSGPYSTVFQMLAADVPSAPSMSLT
jgi:hypothetical protein